MSSIVIYIKKDERSSDDADVSDVDAVSFEDDPPRLSDADVEARFLDYHLKGLRVHTLLKTLKIDNVRGQRLLNQFQFRMSEKRIESDAKSLPSSPVPTTGTVAAEGELDVVVISSSDSQTDVASVDSDHHHQQQQQQQQQQHSSSAAKVNTRFSCKMCNRIFPQKFLLANHRRHCPGRMPFACKLCPDRFKQKNHFSNHMRTEHNGYGVDLPFACDFCERSFSFNSGLVKHLKTHSEAKPYACRVCRRKFTNVSDRTAHECTHSVKKPHVCKRCHKHFKSSRRLKYHNSVHCTDKKKSSKKRKRKNNLNTLMCKTCDQEFVSRNLLVRHQLNEHNTEEKPLFPCTTCDKKFRYNCNLAGHQRFCTSVTNQLDEENSALVKKSKIIFFWWRRRRRRRGRTTNNRAIYYFFFQITAACFSESVI